MESKADTSPQSTDLTALNPQVQYTKLMQEYTDKYYCMKNTDGVYVLVNHPAYSVLKGRKHNADKIHIENYGSGDSKLFLTMIDGNATKFNNRCKLALKQGVSLHIISAEDGGFIIFDSKHLDVVADAFGIKKRRIVTEAMKENGKRLAALMRGDDNGK